MRIRIKKIWYLYNPAPPSRLNPECATGGERLEMRKTYINRLGVAPVTKAFWWASRARAPVPRGEHWGCPGRRRRPCSGHWRDRLMPRGPGLPGLPVDQCACPGTRTRVQLELHAELPRQPPYEFAEFLEANVGANDLAIRDHTRIAKGYLSEPGHLKKEEIYNQWIFSLSKVHN